MNTTTFYFTRISSLTAYNRGIVRYSLGEKLAAIEDFTQAIKLNQNFSPAYTDRGVVRYSLGEKLAAIEDFTQAIKLNRNDADAYYNRGEIRYNLGDKSAGIEDYQKAADLYQKQGETDKYQDALNKLRLEQ